MVFLSLVSIFVLFLPLIIYDFVTMDVELKNHELRDQLKKRLEKEMKEINLPPKTAVNNFTGRDKNFSIFIETRYRTEVGRQEFVHRIAEELGRKGWIYYGNEDSQNYSFCRGKHDATLYFEGDGGLFSDDGNYYKLSFHSGLRPLIDFNNSRPENCK